MGAAMVAAGAIVAGGAGIAAWAAIHPSAQLYGPTIRHTGDTRTMALTFDDGPNPAVTPSLLDLLDAHNVRATFFLIGKHVRACPALAREICARRHALGNHTDAHPNLMFLSPEGIRNEVLRAGEAIAAATGLNIRCMRPPFGLRSPYLDRAVRQAGCPAVVMWSVWAWDWKPQPAELVIRRLRRARAGDIVLLHDGDHRVLNGDRRHTVEALEFWLPRWKDAGIRFVTLDPPAKNATRNGADPAKNC